MVRRERERERVQIYWPGRVGSGFDGGGWGAGPPFRDGMGRWAELGFGDGVRLFGGGVTVVWIKGKRSGQW